AREIHGRRAASSELPLDTQPIGSTRRPFEWRRRRANGSRCHHDGAISNAIDERARLGGRLGLEFYVQTSFECCVREHRAGAISKALEHLEELTQHAFVPIRKLDRASRAQDRGREVLVTLPLLGERSRS